MCKPSIYLTHRIKYRRSQTSQSLLRGDAPDVLTMKLASFAYSRLRTRYQFNDQDRPRVQQQEIKATEYLVEGTYYSLRVLYGNQGGGPGSLYFEITSPAGVVLHGTDGGASR